MIFPAQPTESAQIDDVRGSGIVRILRAGALALFALGALARLMPLFNHGGRLMSQYPTEDGYMLLTVARNLAIGKGMSIADGTIATNGVQPLTTFMWSAVFALVGGDRESGVAGVLLCELGLAVLAAILVVQLGLRIFGRATVAGRALAFLAGGLWFSSPVALPHTMNCLESGLYVTLVVATALVFLRESSNEGPWTWRGIASLGALLGLAFWARNDAVFLGMSLAAVHIGFLGSCSRWRRSLEVGGIALLAGVIGLPWVLHNLARFGHPVPVSGQSESLLVAFGENLGRLPLALAEGVGVMIPIPDSLEGSHVARSAAAAVVVLLGIPAVAIAFRAGSRGERRLIALAAGFWILLAVYYGLLFGAAHFLPRYMFPTTPFFAVLLCAALRHALRHLPGARGNVLAVAVAGATFLVALALSLRAYARGNRHEHFQVVAWVQRNVPTTTWVGAAQSGTLGFFHDRTVNLDGKVNPDALHARRARRIPEYVLESDIQFIADWADFVGWAKLPPFQPHLEILVHDPASNLAVLRRRGARTVSELAGVPAVAHEPTPALK